MRASGRLVFSCIEIPWCALDSETKIILGYQKLFHLERTVDSGVWDEL